MKIQFKNQQFQTDATKAVVNIFDGQEYRESNFRIDTTDISSQSKFDYEDRGFKNHKLTISDDVILQNMHKVQRKNDIKLDEELLASESCNYNFTVKMETGVGKTYTYIKTMYELNKAYGWSRFIIVVPSIAIREGVFKSFQLTAEHFKQEYPEKIISFFIYNSANIGCVEDFARSDNIKAMIINSQAFNSEGEKKKINQKLDKFGGRRPIDLISSTNPILIIDEPQSVEGIAKKTQTKESLKLFKPLFILRYSATPPKEYNLVYRLDPLDAYNKKLVKKISVKGIEEVGTTATNSFIYFEKINLSHKAPTATIRFDKMTKTGIKQKTKNFSVGDSIYEESDRLEEYKDGFKITSIDGRYNSIRFENNIEMHAGDIMGQTNEDCIRRIQIRETILSHLQKERNLFHKGIKCLSLFFIDEVSNYRKYDEQDKPQKGKFAEMFEEEYESCLQNLQAELKDESYLRYLGNISTEDTHAGYFSIDKKRKMVNSKYSDKRSRTSDDVEAYDLIMKNKELLLDLDETRSPVRFIFSHSALREGWDNPNVFQICTLKQSGSEIKKRQEVGRGLRLCVNKNGYRIDYEKAGDEVHKINVLTVIASESYKNFVSSLQQEISDSLSDRPKIVTKELFINRQIKDTDGNEITINEELANDIIYNLRHHNYIDKTTKKLTEKFEEDKKNNSLEIDEEYNKYLPAIVEILNKVYTEDSYKIENEKKNNVRAELKDDKLEMKEFNELWDNINSKSYYQVDLDQKEIIANAIHVLNERLDIAKIYLKIEEGTQKNKNTKEEFENGNAFVQENSTSYRPEYRIQPNKNVKYDFIGRIGKNTGLTRKEVGMILSGLKLEKLEMIKYNPEDFILKSSQLIQEAIAKPFVEHITYYKDTKKYSKEDIFQNNLSGILDVNAIATSKNIYDYLVYDSEVEKKFAEEVEKATEVAVYTKLPANFKVRTPLGDYNPDWAIAFNKDSVKHIYFVAETKGSLSDLEFRKTESAKIKCAEKHFKVISNDKVKYDVVTTYSDLLQKVLK